MLFETIDPLNRKVKLKKSTWEFKIADLFGYNSDKKYGNSHKDVDVETIKKIISNPTFIIKDTKEELNEKDEKVTVINPNRDEYYKLYINSEECCFNCQKVIVEFDENEYGDIVTSYKMNGKVSKIKTDGGVIYDASEKS